MFCNFILFFFLMKLFFIKKNLLLYIKYLITYAIILLCGITLKSSTQNKIAVINKQIKQKFYKNVILF